MAARFSASAFTLFEIAISLLVLSVAILSVMLAYPIGIKAQRLARLQTYANTKVLEMIDTFSNSDHTQWECQTEAEQLGQNTFMRFPVDLDRLMQSAALGLLPLPRVIASRIDSDGDEIAKLIDAGGQLYFVAPKAFNLSFDSRGSFGHSNVAEIPLSAQTLVFGVVGYAQQNALPSHPCLAWPYQEAYPSPQQPWELTSWMQDPANGMPSWPAYDKFSALSGLPQSFDGPYSDGAKADAYLAKAQDLVTALYAPSDLRLVNGKPVPSDPPDLASIPAPWSASDEKVYPPPWKIIALRCLAHAAMARTATGITPAATPGEQDYAIAAHESCLKWTIRYASTSPYDWGAPRPFNRPTAWDYPLIEFDLLSPAFSPNDGTGDQSWLVIGGKKPVNHGQARGSYGWTGVPGNNGSPFIPPNLKKIANSWGDSGHFNLTKPFAAAERIRRLMCWSVDWQSYEDFETAPPDAYNSNVHFIDSRGVEVTFERDGKPPDMEYHFNPDNITPAAWDGHSPMPKLESVPYKNHYIGYWGVDRNANGVKDYGPMPKSTRMHATTVAQYDFYDPRFICSMRN